MADSSRSWRKLSRAASIVTSLRLTVSWRRSDLSRLPHGVLRSSSAVMIGNLLLILCVNMRRSLPRRRREMVSIGNCCSSRRKSSQIETIRCCAAKEERQMWCNRLGTWVSSAKIHREKCVRRTKELDNNKFSFYIMLTRRGNFMKILLLFSLLFGRVSSLLLKMRKQFQGPRRSLASEKKSAWELTNRKCQKIKRMDFY